jgi:seryl-tRNA synthetase
MLDLDFIRNNPDAVVRAAEQKGITIRMDEVLRLDRTVRRLKTEGDELRAKKNQMSATVPTTSGVARKELLQALQQFGKKLEIIEGKLSKTTRALAAQLLEIPNVPKPDVPVSQDETNNKIVRSWGSPVSLPKASDHAAIGIALGILDIERASKLSGTRFAVLRGAGAALEFALVDLARNHLEQNDFELVLPPVLIKEGYMQSMGYLAGGGEGETYHLQNDKLYLVGTAEQALGPLYAGETFAVADLPKRLLGFSSSFRREAGSYGKDTKGLIRVHQFDKVEMFAFTTPEDSDAEHERFVRWEEELVQALEIPYRVVKVVTGALGYPAARRYDIECWFPSQRAYRETHSASTTTDFQTRRLGVKAKGPTGTTLAHAVNGTAFAIGRTVAALLENGQQPDGSVRLPRVLAERMGTDRLQAQ